VLTILSVVSCMGGIDPTRVIDIPLGDRRVQLRIYEVGPIKDIAYAHVHENEVASLTAAIDIIGRHGGKIVSLSHSPVGTTNRYVKFSYRGTVYQFDPNRIYTRDLQLLARNIAVVSGKGKVTPDVVAMVGHLADKIWAEVKDFTLIIALHNNRNAPAAVRRRWFMKDIIEDESYNITSYVKKCDNSSDSNQSCADIYINPKMNNSEFFIVTMPGDFYKIVAERQTVVLQNEQPIDDGSMSVWAASHQKRYINAEAKHGRVMEQKEMLGTLMKLYSPL
jgi:hypothetical protein